MNKKDKYFVLMRDDQFVDAMWASDVEVAKRHWADIAEEGDDILTPVAEAFKTGVRWENK